MSIPTIKRIEALKQSLEAARDFKSSAPEVLTGEYRTRNEYHMRGLRAGLQIAIDVLEAEVSMIRAGDAAVAKSSTPA